MIISQAHRHPPSLACTALFAPSRLRCRHRLSQPPRPPHTSHKKRPARPQLPVIALVCGRSCLLREETTAALPSIPPTRQREGGPEVGAGEFLRAEQRKLRLAQRLRPRFARAPMAHELRHQPARGLVAHLPVARQHALGPGDHEGPPQRHHALADPHVARAGLARAQDDQLRPLPVPKNALQSSQQAALPVGWHQIFNEENLLAFTLPFALQPNEEAGEAPREAS